MDFLVHYKTQKLKITDLYFHSELVNWSNAHLKKHKEKRAFSVLEMRTREESRFGEHKEHREVKRDQKITFPQSSCTETGNMIWRWWTGSKSEYKFLQYSSGILQFAYDTTVIRRDQSAKIFLLLGAWKIPLSSMEEKSLAFFPPSLRQQQTMKLQ